MTQRNPLCPPLSFVVVAIISFSIMATKKITFTILFFLFFRATDVAKVRVFCFKTLTLEGDFMQRAFAFKELASATGARMITIVIRYLLSCHYGVDCYNSFLLSLLLFFDSFSQRSDILRSYTVIERFHAM